MSYFNAINFADQDGNPFGVDNDTEGNASKLSVIDVNSEQILQDILKELKIMNFHLAILTDNNITKQEVE